jgi:D-serine deaminase-like pyridoxal phosphate-dependent protein
MSGLHVNDLDTPALLLDRKRLDQNLERMRKHADTHGVILRPHLKTSKCLDIARLAAPDADHPITVSTLAEARFFASHGYRDILYAVGIAPGKLDQVEALRNEGCDLAIVLDSLAQAEAVAAHRGMFKVLIEVDADGHRSGVQPDSDTLIEIATILRSAGKDVAGIMIHAGESYACRAREELEQAAAQERAAALTASGQLRAAGHEAPIVSIGSTPTALAATDLSGITELRAGVYMFFDLVMREIGVCQTSDMALSVLTTIIGHDDIHNRLVTDAGWTAMSSDRGATGDKPAPSFGIVADHLSGEPIPNLVVRSMNQEHGLIGHEDDAALNLKDFPIGTRLRIYPNHACATGSMHPRYAVLGNEGEVTDQWDRFRGW